MFVFYKKIKARITGIKETPEVQDRDLEEGGKVQEVFDGEMAIGEILVRLM